jgi:NAD(P)-dependent dehydrogenase (short-subunit alcohol dehydrogenase family)
MTVTNAKYAGKKAVITGGTTGIGLATAAALVSAGATVVVTGRSPGTLEEARRVLGPGAHVVRSDTSQLADIDELAAFVAATLGHVDLAFLNAGVAQFKALKDVTESFYDETMSINTKGAYFTAQRLAPLLPSGGSFVLNTSVAGRKGLANHTVYAASKASLRSFARGLAAELAPRGIRVNAVMPGPIETPVNEKFGFSQAELAAFIAGTVQMTPLRRFGTADEVARAVLFLAFEATFTTGAELPVDGGITQL